MIREGCPAHRINSRGSSIKAEFIRQVMVAREMPQGGYASSYGLMNQKPLKYIFSPLILFKIKFGHREGNAFKGMNPQ
jgi:hypothetical protein